MRLGSDEVRKFSSLFLGAVTFVFILVCAVPAHSGSKAKKNERNPVQTVLTSPASVKTPSEEFFLSDIGKIQFVMPTFSTATPNDLPSVDVNNNPAFLQNSYQVNVFYVQVTTNAP